jgi:hypothetical protein
MRLIDYIDALCKEWGATRYFIDNGKNGPKSIFGRMGEGWSIAAADPAQRPDPPEVMLNGALAVSIAIKKAISDKKLTERAFQVLYVHYVERAPTKRKIYTVKLSKKRYYELLHRSHRVIRWHLPPEQQQNEPDESQGDKTGKQKAA